MKNLSIVCFVLFLLYNTTLFSQTNKTDETGLPNDLDTKYTPDKSFLFNSSDDVKMGATNPEIKIKNVFSFDITNLGRSTVSFYYERVLNKIISAQVGLGTTFAKDQIQATFIPVGISIFSDKSAYYNSVSSQMSLTDILKNSKYGSTGIFLASGLKLYVSGTAPKGIYFQAGVTYAVSNLTFNSASNYNGYLVSGSPDIAVKKS